MVVSKKKSKHLDQRSLALCLQYTDLLKQACGQTFQLARLARCKHKVTYTMQKQMCNKLQTAGHALCHATAGKLRKISIAIQLSLTSHITLSRSHFCDPRRTLTLAQATRNILRGICTGLDPHGEHAERHSALVSPQSPKALRSSCRMLGDGGSKA